MNKRLSNWKTRFAIAAGAAVIGLGLVLSTAPGGRSIAADDGAAPGDDWRRDARFMGLADAPVLLVEYSSFICGFCGRHARDTLPPLARSFVDTGEVRYEFRDLPLPGNVGHESAVAARCAHEQDAFWPMHEYLFANQAFLRSRDWTGFAADLGLDIASFEACMARPDHADSIQADVASAYEAAAFGTPTFFLGRNQPGTPDLSSMKMIKGSESFVFFAGEIAKLLQ